MCCNRNIWRINGYAVTDEQVDIPSYIVCNIIYYIIIKWNYDLKMLCNSFQSYCEIEFYYENYEATLPLTIHVDICFHLF